MLPERRAGSHTFWRKESTFILLLLNKQVLLLFIVSVLAAEVTLILRFLNKGFTALHTSPEWKWRCPVSPFLWLSHYSYNSYLHIIASNWDFTRRHLTPDLLKPFRAVKPTPAKESIVNCLTVFERRWPAKAHTAQSENVHSGGTVYVPTEAKTMVFEGFAHQVPDRVRCLMAGKAFSSNRSTSHGDLVTFHKQSSQAWSELGWETSKEN